MLKFFHFLVALLSSNAWSKHICVQYVDFHSQFDAPWKFLIQLASH